MNIIRLTKIRNLILEISECYPDDEFIRELRREFILYLVDLAKEGLV